jgi:hypothetical protein
MCRSQWLRGLRHRSAAACLLRSWVWIPLGAWIFVCCEWCVLSGRGLCDELLTHPEESYRLWCVVCDLETSRMRRQWLALGRSVTKKKKIKYVIYFRVTLKIVKGFLNYGSTVWELWLGQDQALYINLYSEYWKYWLYHHNIYYLQWLFFVNKSEYFTSNFSLHSNNTEK